MHISGEKVSGFEDACKALSKYYDYHSDSGICAAEPRGIGCENCWIAPSCEFRCWTYGFRIGNKDHDQMMANIENHHYLFCKFIVVNCLIEADPMWFKDYSRRFSVGFFMNVRKEEKKKSWYMISYNDLASVWAHLMTDNKYKNREWAEFTNWIRKLPYSELITGGETG